MTISTHELWLLKGRTITNITKIVGTITRRSSTDELGEEITFDVAISRSKKFPRNPCELGDVVILKNKGVEITRAIIVDESNGDGISVQYNAFDYAFYLNKSDAIYQFKKMRADQAIRKICTDFNVPIGNVVTIQAPIEKLYNGENVSSILEDILEFSTTKTNHKYLMEMRQGKLYVERQRDLVVKAVYQRRANGVNYDGSKLIASPSRSRSVADMINTIQIVSNDDKLKLTQSDDQLVRKYGRLQKVVKLDQKETRSAQQVAQSELNDLAKITETASVQLLGDDKVRASRLIDIEEKFTGLKGRYLIESASHTISGGIHRMDLTLGVKK